MADRIVVLRLGHVEQVGAPLDLYNRPANRFVAGFIGSPRMNFLEGRVARADRSGVVVDVPGLPPVAIAVDGGACSPGDAVTLGVRPGHIALHDGEGATARVETTEQLGSESYLYCALPQGQKLTIHHPGQTRIGRAETIRLGFDPAGCHLFRSGDGEPALRPAA